MCPLNLTQRLVAKLCFFLLIFTVQTVANAATQNADASSPPFFYNNLLFSLNDTPEDVVSASNAAQQDNTPLAASSSTTKDEPTSYDALKKLVNEGKVSKAITLGKASLKEKENVDIRVLLGYLLIRTGDYEGAKQQFKIALKNSHDGYPDASDGLAIIDIHNNDYKAALKTINEGLQNDPTSKLLKDRRKQILNYLKNPNSATTLTTTPGKSDTSSSVKSPDADKTTDKKKLNAISVSYEHTSVSDLQEIWQWGSISYKRYTSYGPIIATINRAYQFQEYGTQYLLEAYPHIADGFYLYLGYGYSPASFLANHQYNYEGFFSLPHSYEFSIGERLLQFENSTTQVYTGSIGKYIGNYWISYRPYITDGISHSLTIRRYFSSPESYVSLSGSYGTSPDNVTNTEDVSADRTNSLSLSGQFPIKNDNFLFNWKIGHSLEHFPTEVNRYETDLLVGVTWKF